MTVDTYVTYGFVDQAVEDLIPAIEAALGIKFVTHESFFRGIYYRCGRIGQENFVLQPNFIIHHSEWMSEKYRDVPVLLEVNNTRRPDEVDRLLQEQIPCIRKLEWKDFPQEEQSIPSTEVHFYFNNVA